MGDTAWGALLERHDAVVWRTRARFGGREVETTGHGFFASFDGPGRRVRAALAIRDAVGDLGLEVRSDLHVGECEIADGKPSGIAVHTTARVSGVAEPGEVLVSSNMRDLLVGADLDFEGRGTRQLRGIPGEWTTYEAAVPAEAPPA
jgi:class 3 adenylate cyclase